MARSTTSYAFHRGICTGANDILRGPQADHRTSDPRRPPRSPLCQGQALRRPRRRRGGTLGLVFPDGASLRLARYGVRWRINGQLKDERGRMFGDPLRQGDRPLRPVDQVDRRFSPRSVSLRHHGGQHFSQQKRCGSNAYPNRSTQNVLDMKLSKAAETQRMSHRGFQSLCHHPNPHRATRAPTSLLSSWVFLDAEQESRHR